MKKREPTQRPPCVCITLRRAAQKMTEFYDQAISPAGISINQYSLLANISRMEGCGTGELAQRVKLEKSTLVRTLRPLLRAGLVADKSPEGSRSRQLCLTPAGRKVLKKAAPLWNRAQKEVAARLGKENHDALLDIFTKMDLWE